MLELGISIPSTLMSRRAFLQGVAGLPALALTGLGSAGVASGFTAISSVTGYTATEGRFRRAPSGFVRCGANEERLCFDSAGRFVGQALEGPETYYSAAWDDPGAPNGSGDFAHLGGDSGDRIRYAGEHAEPDIFGGTGGGVVIRNDASNQFHNTVALKATGVVSGDVIRYEAIVAITDATQAGRIELRGASNPSFAFTFLHDAAGRITGTLTGYGASQSFDAEYRDLGIINSKRWYHLIVSRKANSNADAAMGVGFGNIAADTGKKFHFCDIRLVHKPKVAPSSWPVCAPQKTFDADTLQTGLTGTIGALFYGGAGRCRTRITDGALSLVADSYRAHDGFSMVTQIGIIPSNEATDCVGLMPYPEMEREFAFWGGGDRTVLFGPARFAVDVDSTNYPGSYTNLTIGNAFTADRLLRGWVDGRLSLSSGQLTGDLTLDDTIIFPTCSSLDDQFEQVDMDFLHFIDTAGSNFSAQRALFMSHPASHSRARHQVQADDDLETSQVYMGILSVAARNAAGLAMNIADASFQNMGRGFMPGAVGTNLGTRPMTVNGDRAFFYGNWSDDIYLGYGNYAGSSFDNQFHGGFTARRTNLYHSRKEIEVDIGAGWQPLSATDLSEDDLPIGQYGFHVGTYNFGTETLDAETAEPTRRAIVRSWNLGSAPVRFNKVGFQFHSQGVEEGNYNRVLEVGETFVIEQIDAPSHKTPHIRFTADWGYWSTASTFVNSGFNNRPAVMGTGTHADAIQSIVTNFRFDQITSDGMVIIGAAQGLYLEGQGEASSSVVGRVDFTNFIGMTASAYAIALVTPGHGLETDFRLTNALAIPCYQPTREQLGNADDAANYIFPIFINGTMTFDNYWWGNWDGLTIANYIAQFGSEGTEVIVGTPNYVDVRSVTNYDNWTLPNTGNPDSKDFIPEAFREPQSELPDWKLIGNPIETGFRFTEFAETTTGLPLNETLDKSMVTGVAMKPLTDFLKPWQRDQDFIAKVPNTAAIGTKIDVREYQRFRPEADLPVASVAGTMLEQRYGNPRPGLIDFDADGDLAVVGVLSGIDKPFLFKTDADELILVDVLG